MMVEGWVGQWGWRIYSDLCDIDAVIYNTHVSIIQCESGDECGWWYESILLRRDW